jgi:hypothetical protein
LGNGIRDITVTIVHVRWRFLGAHSQGKRRHSRYEMDDKRGIQLRDGKDERKLRAFIVYLEDLRSSL